MSEVKRYHEEISGLAAGKPLFEGQREYVLAANYDDLRAELLAATKRADAVASAAAKWDALRNCARIKLMGCAGLHEDSPQFTALFGHIGLEFWTVHEATGDPQHVNGLEWFDKFMAKALAVKQTSPTSPERVVNETGGRT